MTTIELTPKWRSILPILIMGIENGTPQGRKIAVEELQRLCAVADQYNDRDRIAWGATSIMIGRYRRWMTERKIEPLVSPEGVGLHHVCWMLDELRTKIDNDSTFDIAKASRWLGFIQAEIIRAGWTTVTEERDFSRPLFKPETKE